MKVFFDTNVLVSALVARGLCADLMRVVLAEHELVTGEVNLKELRRVLRDRFKASDAQVALAEDLLRDQVVVPNPAQLSAITVRGVGDPRQESVTPRQAWDLLRSRA
ncbi:MAG: PIN domain-containing protein [Gemmatimonadaceae bacterium]|nr:PIN domain-containing protein [Gemmatimonadaceae bacterium]MCW5827085.1 PIN domain-containing protein [Gemmatimonadaceae bacterium]